MNEEELVGGADADVVWLQEVLMKSSSRRGRVDRAAVKSEKEDDDEDEDEEDEDAEQEETPSPGDREVKEVKRESRKEDAWDTKDSKDKKDSKPPDTALKDDMLEKVRRLVEFPPCLTLF